MWKRILCISAMACAVACGDGEEGQSSSNVKDAGKDTSTGGIGGADGSVGGSAGTGGTAGSGGSAGTGGTAGTGGSAGTGGTAGVGGSAGTGGTAGTGGSAGTGGTAGTGGSAGTGGTPGTGGSAGTGGTAGAAGSGGTGGTAGIGGSAGTGGGAGAGGSAGTGGGGGAGGGAGAGGSAGAGGAAGSGGSAGTDGGAGTGGAAGGDGGTGCVLPTDCPGVDNDCQTRTCTLGVCGFDFIAAGTPTASQVTGDCQQIQCDGAGGETTHPDDSDLPDDSNACTQDICSAGVASNPPEGAGTSCGSAMVCDGAGSCVGCNVASDCSGIDDDCQTRTCTNHVCGVDFEPAGTPVPTQIPGDCLIDVCDGAGHVGAQPDDTDPFVDGNQCTDDLCQNGTPSNPDSAVGAACSQNGGSTCDGNGTCVECVTSLQCPGTDDECQQRTCIANTCGMSFTLVNTPLTTQTAGDCATDACDGTGGVIPLVEDTDLPVDGNQCTSDVCTSGTPSNPPEASGTTCNQGGGLVCDGTGSCVECVAASSCPGTDTECAMRTCIANACGMAFQSPGTVVSTQTSGDCVENVCDGSGNVTPNPDDTDLPVDGNECTDDVCTLGTPSNPNSPPGSACTQGGGLTCDGSGSCVECVSATTCPGTDTECASRTCIANVCGMAFQPAGTIVATQTPGDCQENQCDGAGNVAPAVLDTDLPVDGVECTDDVCTLGVPSNPNSASGALCSIGGVVCDGAGVCVECLSGAECATGVCKPDHTCLPTTCTNGALDPGETDLDCGGPSCLGCVPGNLCTASTDCLAGTCTSNGTCEGDLYFGEYVEGSSNNKAIEIVNLSGQTVDLSQCSVRLYSNGSAAPTSTLTLTGNLAHKGALAICNASSGATLLALCTQTSGVANFNGDDTLELFCNGTTKDVFGQIGVDPGTNWGTGLTSTVDHTLRRKCSVLHGDTNGADAFDPASEWAGFAVDTFSGVGSSACAP